jgi:hypothetical protein
MIAAKAKRKMSLSGDDYAKGDPLSVPKEQFADLGPDGIGWIERAPAEKKAAPKPAETKPAMTRLASAGLFYGGHDG